MRKKLLAILVCIAMITSTIIIFRPESLVVKADNGGNNNGNNLGINLSYIHSKAQELSNITFTFPQGRSFGTPGEHHARDEINLWMNQIGLYNVHTEDILYKYNKSAIFHIFPIPINRKLEEISEGLTVNNTDIRKSEFFINPRWDLTLYPFLRQRPPLRFFDLTKNF